MFALLGGPLRGFAFAFVLAPLGLEDGGPNLAEAVDGPALTIVPVGYDDSAFGPLPHGGRLDGAAEAGERRRDPGCMGELVVGLVEQPRLAGFAVVGGAAGVAADGGGACDGVQLGVAAVGAARAGIPAVGAAVDEVDQLGASVVELVERFVGFAAVA